MRRFSSTMGLETEGPAFPRSTVKAAVQPIGPFGQTGSSVVALPLQYSESLGERMPPRTRPRSQRPPSEPRAEFSASTIDYGHTDDLRQVDLLARRACLSA